MVKFKGKTPITFRKIGWDTKESIKWNVRHGIKVLRNKYHIKNLYNLYLIAEKETNLRGVELKRRAPKASKKFFEIRNRFKELRLRK